MKHDYTQLDYLHLHKKIDPKTHIIATFRIESNYPLKHEAQIIAAESSVGTWTQVKTMRRAVFERLSAKVIAIDHAHKRVKIAYPLALFEPGNIPQLLSSVAGNIFSMKSVKKLRLEDLDMPDKYINSFPGPAFGVGGIRKKLCIYKRPLLGSIMKPKLGLTWRQHAHYAYLAFLGGIDLVKDDENLTSQEFNDFTKRTIEILKLARRAERETGSKKVCALNVTAPADEMIRRAQLIKHHGGRCAMVDIVTVGFSGVQALRNANLGLILHGHRAMHAAFTRDKQEGISMMVLAKLARLAGIDQLHLGTVVGKMEGTADETKQLYKFALSKWGKMKPMLPVASGGLHPGLVPELIKHIGMNMIMNFGGGLHGHPRGTLAGAIAARQSLEATLKHIPLDKYSWTHPELAAAIAHWGRLGW
ncbi:MAG: ribulose-bisphosphate carboxylase large subunit [Patescibacteria group bacterium]|jgi:ribulose-bisphosphate carboxylase large chain